MFRFSGVELAFESVALTFSSVPYFQKQEIPLLDGGEPVA